MLFSQIQLTYLLARALYDTHSKENKVMDFSVSGIFRGIIVFLLPQMNLNIKGIFCSVICP